MLYKFLLNLFGLSVYSGLVFGWDIEMNRIEEGGENDPFWDISGLRITRLKSGAYGFNGAIRALVDLNNDITIEVQAFYSSTGANQFALLPLHITPIGCCDFLNAQYKKYLMNELSKTSDFPFIADTEYYCPLKAGEYEVINYEFEKSSLPQYLKPGLYKVVIHFNETTDDREASWIVLTRITKD